MNSIYCGIFCIREQARSYAPKEVLLEDESGESELARDIRRQSTLAPEALTILPHLAISPRMLPAICSGVELNTS
jgi:hypothetical protein